MGLFTAPATTADYNIKDIIVTCEEHKTRFDNQNKVQFNHAITLKSDDDEFGGFSGLLLRGDKQYLYSITDRARFVSMQPEFDANNNISCVSNTKKRPLRGRSTRPLIGHYGDSEGLSFGNNTEDKILISFERAHRVVEYDITMEQLLPLSDYEVLAVRELPYNKSYETVRMLNNKDILAFPEEYEIKKGILKGFLYNIEDDSKTDIAIEKYEEHLITDIDILSNGDFLTLERHFSFLTGISIIMRHIKKSHLLSGNPTSGEIVFRMTSAEGADNFEGMSIHHNGSHNHIYMIADDNFTSLQKTLLFSLKYDVNDE